MRRFLVVLSACAPTTVPTLVVSDAAIELHREPDHVFTALHAAVDGVDAGNAEIADGTARFAIPALTGPDLHVEIDDGGDAFVLDAPNLLAARNVTVDLPDTLRPGEPIAITTGVATDALEVALYAKRGDAYCLLSNAGNPQIGTARVAFPIDAATAWRCGDPPAPGTRIAITVEATVTITAPIAACSPGLTCEVTGLAPTRLELPATLQL